MIRARFNGKFARFYTAQRPSTVELVSGSQRLIFTYLPLLYPTQEEFARVVLESFKNAVPECSCCFSDLICSQG